MQQSSAVPSQPLLTQRHKASALPTPQSAQTTARTGSHLKLLFPGDIAIPWPQLWLQPSAAVGTQELEQGGFTSSHTMHSHKINCPCADMWCQTTQTSLPAWAPRLGFLQHSPRTYAIQINLKEQGLFCSPGVNLHSPAGGISIGQVLQPFKTGWPLGL